MNAREELERFGVKLEMKEDGGFRIHGLSSLSSERKAEVMAFINQHGKELKEPLRTPFLSNEVPDYTVFCPRYWQGCFVCPDFMPDMIRFCRSWNRAVYGVDVVELVTERDEQKSV